MRVSKKDIVKLRLGSLVLGVFVSWTATFSAFSEFYGYEGTILKLKDCVIPNPITTPCFWGALAFLGGAVWAYKKWGKETKRFERNFLYFMIFSVIFAWSNFAIELRGVKPNPGAIVTVCRPAANPFTSACFFGSLLFTFSLLTTLILLKNHKD